MKLKIIWVGVSKKEGKRIEMKAIQEYGDALLSSGPIILNGKKTYGYAVSVHEKKKSNNPFGFGDNIFPTKW
jgi:hypothetical protein